MRRTPALRCRDIHDDEAQCYVPPRTRLPPRAPLQRSQHGLLPGREVMEHVGATIAPDGVL